MRLALKLGYDGARFRGFARQPGQRTVEGELFKALEALGVLGSGKAPRDIGYAAASRTDAGVSAVGNVIALDTDFRREAILPALNARLEDIWFHSLASVPAGFRPRDARLRWYRYHLTVEEAGELEALKRALRIFVGRHDFRNFCRPEGGSAVRSLRRLRIRRSGELITVDFIARSFLWNQVRRMMGGALSVARGELESSELRRALEEPGRRIDCGLAPPEGLVLMDVAYDFEFQRDERAVELVRRRLSERRDEARRTLLLAGYLF